MDVVASSSPLHEIAADLLAVGATDSLAELAALDAHLGGGLLPALKQRSFTGKAGSAVLIPTLGRCKARDLLIVGLGDRSAESLWRAAGKAGRQARESGAASLALAFGGAEVSALADAVTAGNYSYDKYKPEGDRTAPLATLQIAGANGDLSAASRAADIKSRWIAVTRDLVNGPAAEVYPETLADAAKKLSKIPGVTVEIMELRALEKANYVGIIAVGQGSPREPRVAHIRYRPKNANGHVALVGKGVTFDSGGLSLKPSGSMQTMRCDMAGAATVIGTVAAAAELGLPIAIDGIIGCVENMNSGGSFKLGDVLTYRNGVSVEIHNTDAEGRLVLADCLIDACKEPGVTDVIDLATLTGAVVVAIGPDFTGMFTSDDALAGELDGAAKANHEGLWRLPLHEPYKQWLKGDWGQLKNISGKPDAGSVTAALFLSYFVEKVRWAHLDIAGSAFFDKGNGLYAAGGTGQMVRTLLTWLEKRSAS